VGEGCIAFLTPIAMFQHAAKHNNKKNASSYTPLSWMPTAVYAAARQGLA